MGLNGKLRFFITDFDILASKIHEKGSSAQKQGINKKSLPIFISFNIGWVFQSTNFTVILQLSYSVLTPLVSVCLCVFVTVSLYLCQWETLHPHVSPDVTPALLYPFLCPQPDSLSVHLSPLSVCLWDCATQSCLDAEHLRSKPFDVSSVSSSERCNRCGSISNTECNRRSTFFTLNE